jgi:hypothetical protein
MTLWTIIVLCLIAGVVVFLVKRAPFIDAEWKSYISYGILVVVVLIILSALFGGFTGLNTPIHVGR